MEGGASSPASRDVAHEQQEDWWDLLNGSGLVEDGTLAASVASFDMQSTAHPSDAPPSTEAIGRALFDAHTSLARLRQPRLPTMGVRCIRMDLRQWA